MDNIACAQVTLSGRKLELPKIRTSSQSLEEFDPENIKKVYMAEAGLEEEKAEYYTRLIVIKLQQLYLLNKLKELSTRMLREIMCALAIEEGDFRTRNALTVAGLPIYDMEKLYFRFRTDNINQIPSEEFVHKMQADAMNEQYSLLKVYNFDTKWGNPAYAHLNKDIHIHDNDFIARPFCCQHSARFIFRNGLRIDGTGKLVNVSKSPNNLDVAIKQMWEFIGAASRNWAGGQSYRNPFWELGPFLEKEAKKPQEQKEIWGIKVPANIIQAAQIMRYEPNHVLVGRGSQAAFSSISNFVVPPKYLTEDCDIVLPGGKIIKGSYADYTDLVMKFWLAYLYESVRGDGNGSMFHWAKDDIAIKPAWFNNSELQEYIYKPLMEYIAKFGGPYIYNVKNVPDDEVACTSCCSLVLETSSPEDFELAKQGVLSMGALQCGSINLPRLAYLAKGDEAKVFELLDARMELLKEMHIAKHGFMKKVIDSGLAPFLTQPVIHGKNDTPYFSLEKQSHLISFVGLNEFCKIHLGSELHESWEAHNYGMKLLLHMINYCKKMSDEAGINFSIWRQPAESTAGKFAQADFKKFGKSAVVLGDPESGGAYYSNFTHLNVSAPVSLSEKIRHEAPFHGLSPSNLMHIWLGEESPDTDSLWSLTKKIIDGSLAAYLAFTRETTVCTKCSTTHSGIVASCKCGASPKELMVQSRITGYYGTVGSVESIMHYRAGNKKAGFDKAHWQPSKFSEFHQRSANLAGERFSALKGDGK